MDNTERDASEAKPMEGSIDGRSDSEAAAPIETKHYADGSSATGPGPMPELSPEQQDRLVAHVAMERAARILSGTAQPLDPPNFSRDHMAAIDYLKAWSRREMELANGGLPLDARMLANP